MSRRALGRPRAFFLSEAADLKQGDLSMEEYYKKFMEPSTLVIDEKLNEMSLATRFEDGSHIDVNFVPFYVLLDSGVSHSFIASSHVQK